MRSIVCLALLAAAACSSKPKTTEPVAATPPAHTDIHAATTDVKSATAAEPAKAADNTLTCTKGKETRTLVIRMKDKGCELAYTKGGQEAVVATSKSGSAHCESAREKIASKLKAAGYDCK